MKKVYIWILITILGTGAVTHAQQMELSLKRAMQLALENNKQINIQRLQEKVAFHQSKESMGNLLPSLQFQASYSYYFEKQRIFMPGSFIGTPNIPVADVAVGGRNTFYSSLNLLQPILFESARKEYKTDQLEYKLEQDITKDKEEELKLQVCMAYYQVVLQKNIIQVFEQSLQHHLKVLEDSRNLFWQGKALNADTLKNRINVDNVRNELSYLKSNYDVIELELKNILGMNADQIFSYTDSISEERLNMQISNMSLNNISVDLRTDILVQERRVEISESTLKQERAKRVPSLYFFGSYQLQSQTDDYVKDSFNWPSTAFIGAQLNYPIFSGNRVNQRIKQSKLMVEQSILRLDYLKNNAGNEIEALQSKLVDAQQRMDQQKLIIESARLNYKIMSDRYEHGLVSRIEVSDAELSLNQSIINYHQTLFQLQIIYLHLTKAIGIPISVD